MIEKKSQLSFFKWRLPSHVNSQILTKSPCGNAFCGGFLAEELSSRKAPAAAEFCNRAKLRPAPAQSLEQAHIAPCRRMKARKGFGIWCAPLLPISSPSWGQSAILPTLSPPHSTHPSPLSTPTHYLSQASASIMLHRPYTHFRIVS